MKRSDLLFISGNGGCDEWGTGGRDAGGGGRGQRVWCNSSPGGRGMVQHGRGAWGDAVMLRGGGESRSRGRGRGGSLVDLFRRR